MNRFLTFTSAVLMASCGAQSLPGPLDSGTEPRDAGVVTMEPPADAGVTCTPRADAASWPVKVLFVVQRSSSMCLADPGATGQGNTFCDSISAGVSATRSARVRELLAFLDANATRPELQVSLVTWTTNPTVAPFEPVSSPALRARVLGLESQLGAVGNLQGRSKAHGQSSSRTSERRRSPSGRARVTWWCWWAMGW